MIRLGKHSEIDAIVELAKSCGAHLRKNGIDQWDENYPNREVIGNDIASENLFVFHKNDAPIGIVVLNENQDEEYNQIDWLTDNNTKNIVVHRLAVDPESQGQGIARKLMDYAEDYAKQNKYDSIRLDTFSQNPRNQKFYAARGYNNLGQVYLKYKKEHPYICYEMIL